MRVVIILLFLLLTACEGPQGPPGLDGTVGADGAPGVDGSRVFLFETNFDFSGNTTRYRIGHQFGDNVLFMLYRLARVESDNVEYWEPLPSDDYFFMEPGEDVFSSLNFSFESTDSYVDIFYLTDGIIIPDRYTKNQSFRLFVIPTELPVNLEATTPMNTLMSTLDDNQIELKTLTYY